ncbi:protein maelstrom homolog [Anopheles funestus]|uniref:protein maelstrom homolog n=1 Tax=Anopheles funestus TaxID=62324 RepID=UPI0020C69FC8|nr:protein maelstrom homolog [Anopheles funestus]
MQESATEQHLQKLHEKEPVDLKNDLTTESMQQRVELNDDFTKEDFYIISMLYFCRTVDGVYIPAELGVVQYSVQAGVKKQLHLHINPGKIPRGLNNEAWQHTSQTHNLPMPPNALGLTDNDEIEELLLNFLDAKEQFPLLFFTNAKDVPVVENMLRSLLTNRVRKDMIIVYPLSELLQQLQNSVDVNSEGHLTMRNAQQMFDMDFFSYTSGISCEYHESNSLLNECALSQCIRWAYTISKCCCKHLEMELIPGKHIPQVAVDEQQIQSVTESSEDDNIVHKQELPSVTDDSADETSSIVSVDRISFVSYATHFTAMTNGQTTTEDEHEKETQIQLVCDNVDLMRSFLSEQKSVEDYMESLKLYEPKS